MFAAFIAKIRQTIEEDWPQLLMSAAINGVLVLLATLFVIRGNEPARIQQFVEVDATKEPEFLEKPEQEKIDFDKPLTILDNSPGMVSESTELMKGDPSPTNQASIAREINNKSRNRPLTSSVGKLHIGSLVTGMKGTAEIGGGGGGMGGGAVDVITREILRNLRKGPVLVAWIMDPTESMAQIRSTIANRFDGIYKELNTVGAIRGDSLLNTIVSCGHETKFLTDKPTADVPTIAKAIRSIKDDGTGEENFFDGIMKTATKYHRFQAGGNRIFMIIVVTDETGDDVQNIDAAVSMTSKNKTLVYVVGPGASFAYPEMLVTATSASGETEEGFITRGPSTRRLEVLKVPFNTTPYKDAWGPYGLSYISRETGAIFWVLNDDRLSGPEYDLAALAPYKPFYGTQAEYQKEIGKTELRKAVMEVCDAGNKLTHPKRTDHTILAENAAKKVDELQKEIQPFLAFSRGAVARMEAAEPKRTQETNPAWLANFDLTMGRLLQARVIAEEYADALSKVRGAAPGGANAWSITQSGTIDVVGGGGGESGTGGLAGAPMSVLAEKAKVYFNRIIAEHPNTPWALVAQAEVGQVHGFDAQPITIPIVKAPPAGNGGPGGNRGNAPGAGGPVGGAAGPPPKPPGPPRKL